MFGTLIDGKRYFQSEWCWQWVHIAREPRGDIYFVYTRPDNRDEYANMKQEAQASQGEAFIGGPITTIIGC